VALSSEVLLTGSPEAAANKKEEKMRTKFAIALAIVAVCVTAAWAGWNPEFQVTDNEHGNSLGTTSAHKVVIGTVGEVDSVVHVVWYDYPDVYYKRYYPGSGWSEELVIGSAARYIPLPAIALDANGKDIHVVWMSERTSGKGRNKVTDMTIYYRKCVVTGPGNGGWGDTTDLCVTAASCYFRYDPRIACGASGQVVVAWDERHLDGSPLPYSIRFREYVSGAWQDEEPIAGPSDQHHSRPSIAADGSGDVSVSYNQFPKDEVYGHIIVTRRTSGDWQDPEDVTPGDDLFAYSAIEVNPEGNPHIVCWSVEIDGARDYNVYHTYLNDQGDWEDLEVVSDPAVEHVWNPKMFFTVDGVAHVIWALRDTDLVAQAIMYASCPYEGGTWTEPVELVTNDADGVNYPDITGGTDGTLFAVWQRTSTRTDTIGKGKKKKIVEVTEAQIWGMYNTPEGDGGQAEPLASSQLGVELVPNPAKAGRVAVHYSLPRAGRMTVTLVDISGRVVKTQEVAAQGMTGAVSVDVGGLTAGVYVARLVAGDLNVSKSLVVGR
jgi:hypothetical protein